MAYFWSWLFLFTFKHFIIKIMFRYLLALLITVFTCEAFAQIKKSKVVVIGDNETAWAAAVQSARSGVNTLWIREQQNTSGLVNKHNSFSVFGNKEFDSGLWAEFLAKTRNSTIVSDSISKASKQEINPQIAENTFSAISDSLHNLYQVFNTNIKSIRKSGKNWKIQLNNNDKYKVTSIIDATSKGHLVQMIRAKDLAEVSHDSVQLIDFKNIYTSNLYKTSVLLIELNEHSKRLIPLSTLAKTPAENFFVINELPWMEETKSQSIDKNLPLFIKSGQAIGALAAYSAFFTTTTAHVNVRTLQGELFAYKERIIPFEDVAVEDKHAIEIQRIGATGLLKGIYDKEKNSFSFLPKEYVSSQEIKEVMLALYTRSQIWFKEKDIPEMTIKDLLDLIKFTALRGNELDTDVENGWEKRFYFDSDFDLTQKINRRQVAVLMDYYLKPFNVTVNKEGRFKY